MGNIFHWAEIPWVFRVLKEDLLVKFVVHWVENAMTRISTASNA